jgi:hypothetical protein
MYIVFAKLLKNIEEFGINRGYLDINNACPYAPTPVKYSVYLLNLKCKMIDFTKK